MSREMQDGEAIRQLGYTFGACVDTHQHDRLADLFVEDGVLDLSGSGSIRAEGREAIRRLIGGPMVADTPSMHLYSNPVVELDGDRAAASWSCLVYVQYHGATLLGGGQCDDEYVRTADGWRFVSRKQRWLIPPEAVAAPRS